MNLWNTLRITVRTWRRTPALAVVIVATLALGLGATTAALTIAYSMLVQPLPFPDPERLVWVTTYDTRALDGQAAVIGSNRLPQFADWQHNLSSFEQIGGWAGDAPDVFTVTGTGTPERVSGLRVTHQLLDLVGALPATGRLFREGDDAPGAAQTVVLSHGYWQRRFAGAADVVGRAITIENEPHTIVGIVSNGFPLSGSLFASAPIDLYLPLTVDGDEDIGAFMAVIGRLRPGIRADQARADLASRQAALSVGKWEWMTVLGQRVTPLPALVTRDARMPVLLLLAAAGAVLLLACANLVNLLLVRASGRRREMQLRMALGASMRQVLGQVTIESAALVGASGVIGIWLTVAVLEVFRRAEWVSIARIGDLHVGIATLACVLALCTTITVVFAIVAVLQLKGRDLTDALRPHAGVTIDRRGVYVQRVALAVQAAVAIVLTIAGGLLARSLGQLLDVDPGFNARGAMAIRVDPAGRLEGADRLPFFLSVVQGVSGIPGVESAALTIHVPMGDRPSMGWDAIPQTWEHDPATDNAAGRIVSPRYFDTIGVRLLEGRDFDWNDVRSRPLVMAMNETFARRIRAQGREPLRSRFLVLGNVREVVAIVSDVKHRGLDGDAGREAYIPIGQAPTFFQAYDLVVRAADPSALVPAIRSAIQGIDRNQALGTPVALEDYISRTLRPRRLLTGVVGAFAATTLVLAALGVYGVVRYRLAQQMKEIAIRVALGAPGWRVAAAVLSDTIACVGVGLAGGLVLALSAASAIRGYLFGVEPRDGATLAVACALVTVAALLAAYIPARRAPHVDPSAALRAE
jgi:predicted permease